MPSLIEGLDCYGGENDGPQSYEVVQARCLIVMALPFALIPACCCFLFPLIRIWLSRNPLSTRALCRKLGLWRCFCRCWGRHARVAPSSPEPGRPQIASASSEIALAPPTTTPL